MDSTYFWGITQEQVQEMADELIDRPLTAEEVSKIQQAICNDYHHLLEMQSIVEGMIEELES